MSLGIAGMGWVTPLGSGVDAVWQRLLRGDEARAEKIGDEISGRSYSVFRVPDSALAGLPQHPRLRRVSAISRFAVAAGLEAIAESGVKPDPLHGPEIALIFAISNGGVIYTKRFYRDIVKSGPASASPLFFPETVFNAPASHLAAILRISGATYTLVGDGAVGLLAIKMAEDLMANGRFDYCLVVAAEEVDWLLCDAYRKWRLLRLEPPLEPFNQTACGMILSEGAGAVLLAREGPITVEATLACRHYRRRRETANILMEVLSELTRPGIGLVVASANGTFIDKAECEAICDVMGDTMVYTPKPALGESVGAGCLWQIIVASRALREGRLPPLLHISSKIPLSVSTACTPPTSTHQAIVLSCGLNQQIAGLRLGK